MRYLKDCQVPYVLYVIYGDYTSLHEATPAILPRLQEKFTLEECKKKFYTLSQLETETRIKINSLHDIFLCINSLSRRRKVVFIDEMNSSLLLSKHIENEFDLEKKEMIFSITCVAPVIEKKTLQIRDKLRNVDTSELLTKRQLLVQSLTENYRNSAEIWLFYNVFAAHRYLSSSHGKECDIMKNTSPDSSRILPNLKSGPKPLLLTYKEEPTQWSDDSLKTVTAEVFEQIIGQEKSVLVICDKLEGDCGVCESINRHFYPGDLSTTRTRGVYYSRLNLCSYRGVGIDNVIIHFTTNTSHNDKIAFEFLSLARKHLIMIMSVNFLIEVDYSLFFITLKEMISHEEQCNNQICKNEGWNDMSIVAQIHVDLSKMWL